MLGAAFYTRPRRRCLCGKTQSRLTIPTQALLRPRCLLRPVSRVLSVLFYFIPRGVWRGLVADGLPLRKGRAQTGEEGEEVLAEVKSVKLYVKRGEKPFGGGMSGTLRHLVHKETQSERLCKRFSS
jgi:hypothetical protein